MQALLVAARRWRRSALVARVAHPAGRGRRSSSRFGWIELIDATTYLNHYWFLTLVGALAVVAPLGRAL